ncbi:hypothetical protein ACFP56_10165 [Paenibacillus septentrionalis]|uniref:YrzO family protein n=1 Tax=Paenibacillus septentrionalis TaxID=429342 RepID=A0ABW1V5D1_9BACL
MLDTLLLIIVVGLLLHINRKLGPLQRDPVEEALERDRKNRERKIDT